MPEKNTAGSDQVENFDFARFVVSSESGWSYSQPEIWDPVVPLKYKTGAQEIFDRPPHPYFLIFTYMSPRVPK